MRLITFLAFIIGFNCYSQTHISTDTLKASSGYENIHIQKISDDEEQTTFVIWVKKNVRAHYHAVHSENIIVLEGEALMTVNGEERTIKAGDYLNFYKRTEHAVLKVTSEVPLKVISVQCPQFIGKDRIFVEKQ